MYESPEMQLFAKTQDIKSMTIQQQTKAEVIDALISNVEHEFIILSMHKHKTYKIETKMIIYGI